MNRSESNGHGADAHGNSFALGASVSVSNGRPQRPSGQASIWDHLEPGLYW